MSDLIITEQCDARVMKRIRSPKITLFNPESGDKSAVFMNVEAKYIDDQFDGESSKSRLVKVMTNEVMMEDITYVSPIDGLTKEIKVAEIMAAIQNAYVDWYNNATPDEIHPVNPRRG